MAQPASRPDQDPDFRPWEQPGALRRDCEPHRGGLIRALGTAGLVFSCLSALGVCLPPLALSCLLAIGLGTAARVLGRRDLRAMEAGRTDPAGKEQTIRGVRRGDLAVTQAILTLAACLIFWGALLFTATYPLPRRPPA